jgi:hypothetical protein
MAPILNMAFFLASFSRNSGIRQKLQNAKNFANHLIQNGRYTKFAVCCLNT